MLKLEKVGLTDNFFALGGDSILSMQVVARSNELKAYGFDLNLSKLMQSSSIEELVFEKWGDRCLLSLTHSARKLPRLFCIHGGFGTVFDYLPLARRLDQRWKVVGVQSKMLFDLTWEDRSLVAMAKSYAGEIRKMQPEGPYYLMGWSLGGALCLLITSELESQGCEVRFVGIVDGFVRSAIGGFYSCWMDELYEFVDLVTVSKNYEGAREVLFDGVESYENILRAVVELMVGRSVYMDFSAEDLAKSFRSSRVLAKLARNFPGFEKISSDTSFWWIKGREAEAEYLYGNIGGFPSFENVIDVDHYSILSESSFIDEVDVALSRCLTAEGGRK
ncbi:thioesterase domain-containing protein [Pseudomonas sp. LRF_L74]|uniref:thioesterase domain-containing protein n=1 Tax=Pseudomonas sp. LRF_L74 TaxID=3369422 RepID=UPI003F5E765D